MSNMALQYGMMKRRKMAEGGSMKSPCETHGMDMCRMCHGGKMMAEGGETDDSFVGEEQASGYSSMPMPQDEEDLVSRIMRQRAKSYSEGGRVANDTPPMADFEDNQFDDLVKDDDLDQHYTGENSGDELGNEQMDEDERDIVARIMRARRMKDRMPVPA